MKLLEWLENLLGALAERLTRDEWLAAVLYGIGWTGIGVGALLWVLIALRLAWCP